MEENLVKLKFNILKCFLSLDAAPIHGMNLTQEGGNRYVYMTHLDYPC
jgi:hypothetical protein